MTDHRNVYQYQKKKQLKIQKFELLIKYIRV